MEEDKILHGILLKKAKEAQYTNYEIEQLNLQSESLFIRYFLEREAAKIVENTNIEENVLKKIYEENQTLYKFPKKVKIDTIFVKDLAKAEEILKEVNLENFNELKDKNDEKGQEAKGVTDEFLFITEIHPAIAEEILQENGKNVIIKKAIPVQEGFHILYLKDMEEEARQNGVTTPAPREAFTSMFKQAQAYIVHESTRFCSAENKAAVARGELPDLNPDPNARAQYCSPYNFLCVAWTQDYTPFQARLLNVNRYLTALDYLRHPTDTPPAGYHIENNILTFTRYPIRRNEEGMQTVTLPLPGSRYNNPKAH